MQKRSVGGRVLHVAPIGPELPSVIEERAAAMQARKAARQQRPPEPKSEPDLGEGPTPQRLAKAGDDVEVFTASESTNHRTVRMLDLTPIDKLRKQMMITADQYNAGCRYHSDWFKAGQQTQRATDYALDRVDGGTHKDLSEAVLAALTRYNHALKALDHDSSIVLQEIVLHEKKLRKFADERYREFPQHRERRAIALNLLRKALSQLVTHYWPPRRDGIRSAMAPDGRPTIMPAEDSE